MKRRRILQSLAALPAATLPHVSPAQTAAPTTVESPLPKTPVVTPDTVATAQHRFFTPEEFAALRRLGELIVPAGGGNPGALEADASEFLDFLLSRSPADRRTLYKQGLDRLNRDARQKFAKPFAELDATQAAEFLKPLRAAWVYDGPADPYARFLTAAKEDFLQATHNSRQWAMAPTRGRGAAGMGMYWFPLE